jgi:hypothetical protein
MSRAHARVLLDACDGRRDRVARLSDGPHAVAVGLRAAEVAALPLDGILVGRRRSLSSAASSACSYDDDGEQRYSHLASIDHLRSSDGGRVRRHQ